MSLVDTHCHINFDSYDSDRVEVLKHAEEQGVTRIIIPAIDLETSRSIRTLVQQYDGLFATVGIHPNSTNDFQMSMIDELRVLAHEKKVVAVGEIGLDYHWDKSSKEQQFKAFEAQLELATTLELPVIIHNREASEDVMTILEKWVTTVPTALKERPGVLHSFSAPAQIAKRALDCGFYLGFTGPITYKNADDLRRIAATVPMDRILVETDGPFLTPIPHRGKRNEPAYIPIMVERLAALKQISPETMGVATIENAERLFHLS